MSVTPILTDAATRRDAVRAKAVEGLQAAFPLKLRDQTLELRDVRVLKQDFGPEEQKQAIMQGTSLHEPVKGTVVLKDAAGKELETVKNFTLLHLPYMTGRHTFIVGGNEYQVSNQVRMKPGVYARKRANEELEAAFNLAKGSNFRLSLDPVKGHPLMEYASTTIPLYPVLRQLGVPHADIAHAWGGEVAENNRTAFDKKHEAAVEKLYRKLLPPLKQVHDSHDARLEAVRAAYAETVMDPDVNNDTLGHPHEKVTPLALLDASKKLLKIYKSDGDVDDRDSLAFKTFHSVDDFVKERIHLDARALANKVKLRATNKTALRDILPPAPFSAGLRTFLTGSQLSAIPTQINPMEMVDQAVKVTSLGEGGISSDRAVPLEARQLHHTHLGIMDTSRTPESFHAGIDIRAAMETHRDKSGNLYAILRNRKTGKTEPVPVRTITRSVVAFPNQSKNGSITVMKDGRIQNVPASQADFELVTPGQLFSPTTNLVPFIESSQGNRITMGSKMQTQALPLLHREVPLVQAGAQIVAKNGDITRTSYESLLGRLAVPVAPVAGKVVKVDSQYIYIDPTGKHAAYVETKVAGAVKRQVTLDGITFKVELEKGDERSGTNPETGKTWTKTMSVCYGHIPKTRGDDGETVDIYLDEEGPRDTVYVVHQRKKDGAHDEDKCMVGFASKAAAKEAYEKHGPPWGFGSLTEYTWSEFQDDYLAERRKEAADKTEKGLIKVPYDTHFPFASKTSLHHTLMVKPGDHVKADQVLGDSNFTQKGDLALGKNMSVAYLAYYGMNSNDAVVISESAAKKLTSEHVYKEVLDTTPDMTLGREVHRQYYGNLYTAEQYGKLSPLGVVRKGQRVMPHDPLIVGVSKTKMSSSDVLLSNLKKSLVKPYRELVRHWEHDFEGEVLDVFESDRRVVVVVRTYEPMRIGDKLSGRYGNKGVVSQIVPDTRMVKSEKGDPIDILYTSAGVISRINPAQIIETAVAKVAEKTGKPIQVESFSGRDNVAWAKQLLKEHGVKDKEMVFDPVSGKHIPDIMVGKQYTLRLFKTTDSNFSARDAGLGYDVNQQPSRGGAEGAKGIGNMEFNALVAHNARNVLREAASLKSQKNDEFWRALQLGLPLPALKTPFAFNKFTSMLQASGVRVDQRGSKISLLPLTDNDIAKMSAGAIQNEKLVRARDLAPERGGFFDPALTGGGEGTRWTHIDLAEPVVNPVFVEPVRRLLGLTTKQFDELHFNKGGAHFKKQLNDIDVDAKLKELHAALKKAPPSKVDDLLKQTKYLDSLRRANLKAGDAYVLSKLPVIPPVMRPILPGNGGQELVVGDSNLLYQNAMLHNKVLASQVSTKLLPPDEHAKLRENLHTAVGAVIGTNDTDNQKLLKRNVKGFLEHLTGKTTPKSSFFHQKLLSRKLDLSGRGTAAPDGSLDVDQVGLPEDMMWELFGKFVIARLVRRGFGAVQAKEMLEKRHPAARDALLAEAKERPVILNRAPTLHRYGLFGAYATPITGKTIRVNAAIEKGMNLDYDGDKQQARVICYLKNLEACTLEWRIPRQLEGSMAARLREVVGVSTGGEFFSCDLAEFPHEGPPDTRGHIDFYAVPAGVQVLAYAAGTNSVRLCDVTSWSVHRDRAVEIVTLASGRQIVTDDDPRAVYGVRSDLKPVRARPAEAHGIFVPVVRDLASFATTVTEVSLGDAVGERLKTTAACTVGLGRLLGTLAGDGWATFSHGEATSNVRLAAADPTIAEGFKRDLLEVFQTTPRIHSGTRVGGDFGPDVVSTYYQVHSLQFSRWVSENIGHGAKNKHLPPFFLGAPREFKRGLLAGLLDTDGSIALSGKARAKPQWLVNFSTVSLRLAREVVLLAMALGVRGKITSSKTPRDGACWTVSFSTVDLHQLGGLPLNSAEKRRRFDAFFAEPAPATSSSYLQHQKIPTPAELIDVLLPRYPQGKFPTEYVQLRKGKKLGYLSRALAEAVVAAHAPLMEEPRFHAWLFLVNDKTVSWDPVESVEKTGIVETGYDLTVPGHETFMAVDGVILSNTLQVHAPVLPSAVEDVKRMTVSKLVFSDARPDDLVHGPRMEAALGLFYATAPKSGGSTKKFKDKAAAVAAYRRGDVKLTDEVEIG